MKTNHALITSACIIGATVFGQSPIARADWDIEAFDKCMAQTVRSEDVCCFESGGQVGTNGHCVAPPANAQGTQGTPKPRPVVPGGISAPPTEANRP
jgi:hypothetical protein